MKNDKKKAGALHMALRMELRQIPLFPIDSITFMKSVDWLSRVANVGLCNNLTL